MIKFHAVGHRPRTHISSGFTFIESENFEDGLFEERVEVFHGRVSYHPAVDLVAVAGKHEVVAVLLAPPHLPGEARILFLLLFAEVVDGFTERGLLDLPEVYAAREFSSCVVEIFGIDHLKFTPCLNVIRDRISINFHFSRANQAILNFFLKIKFEPALMRISVLRY